MAVLADISACCTPKKDAIAYELERNAAGKPLARRKTRVDHFDLGQEAGSLDVATGEKGQGGKPDHDSSGSSSRQNETAWTTNENGFLDSPAKNIGVDDSADDLRQSGFSSRMLNVDDLTPEEARR